MYQNLRRGQLYLKSFPAQGPSNNLNGPSRSIAVLAVLLFALAGLMTGFAVGGFIHSKSGQSSNTGTAGTGSNGQSTQSSSSPTSHPKFLGLPQDDLSSTNERADGTIYTLTTQAIYKSDNKPAHASDITCKVWLVHRIPPGNGQYNIPDSILSNINAIQNPLTGSVHGQSFEEVSGLVFNSSTPQTHLCDANGRYMWKYQISSSVVPGDYDLVVLTDWRGVHYNYDWINIEIS